MGKDKFFWKKKVRKADSLRREVEKREPYDVVLIVCEGSKTEPNYLRSIVKDFGLTNANVEVSDSHLGTDCLSVVNSAIELYRRSPIYDRVYCVFDRDDHSTFDRALQLIGAKPLGNGVELHACVSVPCFEFWLLLHYGLTTRPFAKSGKKSKCDGVVDRIVAKGLKGYRKGMSGVYAATQHLLSNAIKNAEAVRKSHGAAHGDPSTEIHVLIKYLEQLKKKSNLKK